MDHYRVIRDIKEEMEELRFIMSIIIAEKEEKNDWNNLIDEEMETRRNSEGMMEQNLEITAIGEGGKKCY